MELFVSLGSLKVETMGATTRSRLYVTEENLLHINRRDFGVTSDKHLHGAIDSRNLSDHENVKNNSKEFLKPTKTYL